VIGRGDGCPIPVPGPGAAAQACRYLGLDVLDALQEIGEFAGEPVARHFARRRLLRSLTELQSWLARGSGLAPTDLAFRRAGARGRMRAPIVPATRTADLLLTLQIRIEDAALPLWALVPTGGTAADLTTGDGAPILFGPHDTGTTRLTPDDARTIVRTALAETPAWQALTDLFEPAAPAIRPH
jgi:hypothetical protein